MTIYSDEKGSFAPDFWYSVRFKKKQGRFDELWEMKSTFRESVKNWLIAAAVHPRCSEICANACSELIENCIKYTLDNTIATVKIWLTGHEIFVETLNEAREEHVQALYSSLHQLHIAPDPKELFIEYLLHPMKGKSQLGLIKIAIETKGILELMRHKHDDIAHVKLHMKTEETSHIDTP